MTVVSIEIETVKDTPSKVRGEFYSTVMGAVGEVIAYYQDAEEASIKDPKATVMANLNIDVLSVRVDFESELPRVQVAFLLYEVLGRSLQRIKDSRYLHHFKVEILPKED